MFLKYNFCFIYYIYIEQNIMKYGNEYNGNEAKVITNVMTAVTPYYYLLL